MPELSYSQYGEDRIIAEILGKRNDGRLLDIGAWDPIQLSNSRLLLLRGWSGILVEPSPLPAMNLAMNYEHFPSVKVVMAAVGITAGWPVEMHMTNDAVSTSDAGVFNIWEGEGGYYGRIWVPTITIQNIFDWFGGPFDFVNIDAEGLSVQIALQLLATEALPHVICVEHDKRQTELMKLAQARHYVMVHDNGTNAILERRR